MAKNKYNYDDDWAEIEDYYGDDIDNPDVNVPDIMNTVKELEEKEEEMSEEEKAYLEKIYSEISVDDLTFGEGDPVEYVDNMVVQIEGEDGISLDYEVFGRIQIEERDYIIVHRISDPDRSSLLALRAYADDEGYLITREVTDENELKEVGEQIMLLISDDEEGGWEDIPGGGIQWDDDGQ